METNPVAERITTADEVRAAMARRRVPQSRLAAALNLSQPAVSRRLSGKIDFTVSELHAVADLLDVPAAQLLGEPARSAS